MAGKTRRSRFRYVETSVNGKRSPNSTTANHDRDHGKTVWSPPVRKHPLHCRK